MRNYYMSIILPGERERDTLRHPSPKLNAKVQRLAAALHELMSGKGFYHGAAAHGTLGFLYEFKTVKERLAAAMGLGNLPESVKLSNGKPLRS